MSTIPVSLFLFLTAVSIDSLTAGLTYGTQRVKIRPFAYLILTFIPALFITLANHIGSWLFVLLPATVLTFLSFTLLLLLGLSKLTESLLRLLARRCPVSRETGALRSSRSILYLPYIFPPRMPIRRICSF